MVSKDLVIPVGTGSKWRADGHKDGELMIALRSMEKNYKPLGKVWIIAPQMYIENELKKWLTNVKFLVCSDPYKQNKDGNIIRKVVLACDHAELSNTFVRMSDDQVLLAPVADLPPLYLLDLNKQEINWWYQRSNNWKLRLYKTYRVLRAHKKPMYHYDSHIPMEVDKKKFAEIVRQWPYNRGTGLTINTLYYNLIDIERIPLNGQRGVVYDKVEDEKFIMNALKGKIYLNYNDKAVKSEAFKKILLDKFPEKSKYEK
jgi:hypothetical protein